jgi:hypothetical protein
MPGSWPEQGDKAKSAFSSQIFRRMRSFYTFLAQDKVAKIVLLGEPSLFRWSLVVDTGLPARVTPTLMITRCRHEVRHLKTIRHCGCYHLAASEKHRSQPGLVMPRAGRSTPRCGRRGRLH